MDGQFDPLNDPTPDDRVVALLTPIIVSLPNGEQQVRLAIAASELPLPLGKYRLTVNGTSTIRDAEGNPLNDTDGDGVGADYVQDFTILESNPVNASALRLASGPAQIPLSAADELSAGELEQVFAAAISSWVAAGLAGAQAAWLSTVDVRIADLPGTLLATTYAHRIIVDPTAAGQGWNLDSTAANDGIVPADRVDLLTTLAHELGHVLGLGHADDADLLMSDLLAPGVRHRPWRELVDQFFGDGCFNSHFGRLPSTILELGSIRRA